MRKVKVKRDELEAQGLRVGFKVWGLGGFENLWFIARFSWLC